MGFQDVFIRQPTNETYELVLGKVKDNEWIYDETAIRFKGKPASSSEQKRYVVTKGFVNNRNSVFIIATNLPEEIKVDDKVMFLGTEKIVTSVGYYFDKNQLVDAGIFDPDYIKAISPKGITLD